MDRLFLGQQVAVGIEQGDDAGVLPEVDAHELEPGQVRAELADAGGLGMADPHVLEDRPAAVEHEEPFVAAPGIDPRLGLRVGAEVADREAVGVVLQLGVLAPELAAVVVPERVADRELLAAVAVDVERIRVMAGLPLACPQRLEAVVEDPEVRVTVLDHELPAFRPVPERSRNASESPLVSVYGFWRLSACAGGIQADCRNRPVEPSRTWSLKSLTMTTSLRPSPSMSWIWNGVSAVSRPLRGSGRPSCQSTLPSKVTAVRQLIWMKLSPIRGMFWAISISGMPSPSRSPNRAFRPAPNFGVSNVFQSFGCGFSARSSASSTSRRSIRSSIRLFDFIRGAVRGSPGTAPGCWR